MNSSSKILITILSLSSAIFSTQTLEARSMLEAKRESLAVIEERRPKPHEYYSQMMKAYDDGDYRVVVDNSRGLLHDYPSSALVAETLYTQGVSYFNLREYHLANRAFSDYLSDHSNIKHFEEAIQYKFEIARRYQNGAKKRIFGGRKSPKMLSGKEDAVRIYDEVITTMPRNDLAAKALFHKGRLLTKLESYKEAVDSFQTLIRRFPKNPLSPDSYVAIADTYLEQCREEFADPNLIELAQINMFKFQQDFPSESRIAFVRNMLEEMKEHFASELFATGQFFQKRKKEKAAFLYYTSIQQKYPSTKYAPMAQERIDLLKKKSKHPEDLTL